MAATQTGATSTASRNRRRPWIAEFYASSLGKKYAMAITGIVLMAYVFAHMVGNLKLFEGAQPLNDYAAWLREIAYPALPEGAALWGVRIVLIAAFAIHIHAAAVLTLRNRRARGTKYQSKRDYNAADFASRTMRWSGVIVGLFVLFHLADLTFGATNPDFDHADVYGNIVTSFSVWWIAAIYVVANLALAFHLYHGVWSLFQTMGWNQRRFNHWRRYFAVAFAVVVAAGNLSFPIAVQLGIVG
ncbi:succinate dehydrogenase cytochrome b subunit [Egibacter rhizosphaerae]|uniref:Succinate dehydrogenase cytochrome b subunit n=1 Tax=Egibacter rhizosphaerae TaxID=1670831 RepID=A0A411YHP4_9ACTN|nr:succinate dehydrogenase cytochrome b subunit [Egibacter rhizosphaerae]QBI20641.1 succinate dehydrogenase cytochrome b subunit [Egibacter rhizosphaerae]